MTAPLDIGLEQNDASLSMGQDDIFDLVDTQRGLRKKGGISKLTSDDEMPSDEEEEVEEVEGSDEEIVGSEEERERRVSVLEADLDSMYDAYREKMKERDAKYRVVEARKEKGQLEEWNGLKDENNVESGDDSGEDGGWEEMAAAKEIGDASSDESDYDEPTPGQKRKRPNPAFRKHDVQPPSRAAQLWFSQDIFKEVGEPNEDDEHEDVEMASNSSRSEQDDQGDKVYHCLLSHLSSDHDKFEANDFEIVPAESREDADMWNVEDENVDQAKQAHIQSRGLNFHVIQD
jgi:AdoMet-dependent rRNA methyltransferase SPB1